MIRKALLLKIFNAAYMQRWNDKVRPVELVELDKQAHKMIIAYFLGKFEEGNPGFDWIEVIEGGLFELLQRLVITDLKPPIFYKIKADKEKYRRLNDWIFKEIEPVISPMGGDFSKRFRDYFTSPRKNINRRILEAAHYFATKWEFGIIERANPGGYEIASIKQGLERKYEEYSDLKGMTELKENTALQRLSRSLRTAQVSDPVVEPAPDSQDFGDRAFTFCCSAFLSVFDPDRSVRETQHQ